MKFFFIIFFLRNFMKMLVTGPKKELKKTVNTFVHLPANLSIQARPNTSLLETLGAH